MILCKTGPIPVQLLEHMCYTQVKSIEAFISLAMYLVVYTIFLTFLGMTFITMGVSPL